MNITTSISSISSHPLKTIESMKLNPQTMTPDQFVASKLLFLAQIIMSTIAIPILLLAGLTDAVIRSFKGEGKKALIEMSNALKFEIILVIPVAAVGLIWSLATVTKFYDSQSDYLNKCLIDPNQSDRDVPFMELGKEIIPIPITDPRSKGFISNTDEIIQYSSHYNN